MADGLFVYGTLRPEHAPREIAHVVKKLRPMGQGTIRGRLFNLGEYPAVVTGGENNERIPGAVFALPEDADTLTSLDQYEEFHPEDPAKSLFIRVKRLVTFADGTRRRCWVYLYNQPLPLAG